MIQLSILCSIDSFFAALGLSLGGCANRYWHSLAFSFMVCDALAFIAGASLRVETPPALFASAFIAALMVLLKARTMPALYLLIPVLLSIDNFASGALRGTAAPQLLPLLAGLFSGMGAWGGFLVGRRARRVLAARTAEFVGAAAVCFVLLS